MKSTSLILIILFILFFSSYNLLFSQPQQPIPIQMQVSAGFDGKYKENSWFPVTIQLTNGVLSNQTQQVSISEFEGTLAISALAAAGKNVEYVKEIKLPPFSNKKFCFYVKEPMDNRIDIILRDKKEKEISSNTVVLSQITTSGKLILLTGSPETQIYFNTTNHFNGVDSAVIKPDPQNFPDKWFGFDGIDLIIISDYQKKMLSDEQADALKNWIGNGGRLIVSVGSKWQLFKDSFIEEMLPVEIIGSNIVNRLKIYNEELKSSEGDIVVSNSKLKNGIVINKVEDIPLIVKGKYGLGEVYYLAFDIDKLPFKGWNGQDRFWLGFLNDNRHYKFAEFAIGYFRNFISKIKYLEPPKVEAIGIILLIYLIVVCPINFLILRKKKRLELAWITIPVIVIIFSISIYIYGLLQRGGNLILRNVSIINTVQGSNNGRINGSSLLFTPKRNKFDIQIKNKDAIISEEFYWMKRMDTSWTPYPRKSHQGDFENVQTLNETDEIFRITDKMMKIWTTTYLECLNQIELSGFVDADLKISSDSLYGTITNKTKYKIKDCMFLCGIMGALIGDLDAGQTIEVKYTMQEIENFKHPTLLYSTSQIKNSRNLLKKEDEEIVELRKGLLENLFIDSKLELSRNGIIAIAGWIEGNFSNLDVGKSVGREENINLLIAELNCELARSSDSASGVGRGFNLPTNLVRKALVDYKADNIKFPHQSSAFIYNPYVEPIKFSNGYIIFSFKPPFEVDKFRLLNISAIPDMLNVESSIYNFETNDWENIVLSPNTPLTASYFSPKRGEVLVRLNSEKPQQPNWKEGQVTDINVSFTGELME